MNPQEDIEVNCPWCSESVILVIECIEPEQEYTEDCPACCAPILVRVTVPQLGLPMVEVEREGG